MIPPTLPADHPSGARFSAAAVTAFFQPRYPHIEIAFITDAELRQRFPTLTGQRFQGVYCLVELHGQFRFGPPFGGRVTDRRWLVIEGMTGRIVNEIYDGEHSVTVSSMPLTARRES